jgi:hypothetical protein
MVYNATFNIYFCYIVAVSFIGFIGGNPSARRKPLTCCKSQTNFITYCCIEYTLPWTEFKFTTLVMIGTDCIVSCKSIYLTIITMTAPKLCRKNTASSLMCHWTALYVVVQGSTHIKISVKICVKRKYQEYIHTYISEDCCFYPL